MTFPTIPRPSFHTPVGGTYCAQPSQSYQGVHVPQIIEVIRIKSSIYNKTS